MKPGDHVLAYTDNEPGVLVGRDKRYPGCVVVRFDSGETRGCIDRDNLLTITPAMYRALAEIARLDVVGLRGRMGQALIARGLAKVETSDDTVYRRSRNGGYKRRSYISFGYRIANLGRQMLEKKP